MFKFDHPVPVESYVEDWLSALKEASSCLHSRSPSEHDLDLCASTLKSMETNLQKQRPRWDFAPTAPPPQQPSLIKLDSSGSYSSSNEGGGWANVGASAAFSPLSLGNNRFASFQDFSSDDEEEEEEEDDNRTPFVRRSPRQPTTLLGTPPPLTTPSMDLRRLYIRVMDAQASVSLRRALNCRQNRQWHEGAAQYSICLGLIHKAIMLADETISKLLTAARPPSFPLEEDANIVHVAIQSMANGREEFLAAAKKQEAFLLRKLQPQWDKRDEIKSKMGDRWFENRKPTNQFASLRKEQEKELKDVQTAMKCMEGLDVDQALVSTSLLQQKVSKSQTGKERYNGKRPDDLHRRVSLEEYPDPTEFGWEFTGSSGVAEFFEKNGVKLDWYFTTGTVKTSLDHPVQGRTQLFGEQAEPDMYIKILLDPRAHTGKRYRRRRGGRKSNTSKKRGS